VTGATKKAGGGDKRRCSQIVGHGSKFGRKKEEAIAALLTQRNVEEAARTAGIGTQTLIRWLKIPEFQAAYREARRAAVSQSNARLQQATSAAVSTLLRIMVDANAPASARVRAADRILERAKQGVENEDIEVRVAALEQVVGQRPRAIGRRLNRLEEAFLPRKESWETCHSRARLEAARRRCGLLPISPERLAQLTGKSIAEILISGRQRANGWPESRCSAEFNMRRAKRAKSEAPTRLPGLEKN
jgi:hypothetical protein